MEMEELKNSIESIGKVLEDIRIDVANQSFRLENLEKNSVTRTQVQEIYENLNTHFEGHITSESHAHSLSTDREHSPHDGATQPTAGADVNKVNDISTTKSRNFCPEPLGPIRLPTADSEEVNAAELHREFESIRDSLIRVKLPNDIKVFDSKVGIKQECQPALTVISKCARYTETAFKQLSLIADLHLHAPGEASNDRSEPIFDSLQKLYVILHSEIAYLQSEYTGLLVKSRFDTDTANLFKCFERNNAAFSDRSLENLRRASEISAASLKQNKQSNNWRGGFRGRGQRGRGQSDQFSRSFPPRRFNPGQGSATTEDV